MTDAAAAGGLVAPLHDAATDGIRLRTDLAQAMARLGEEALSEERVATYLRPLFTRTLASSPVYLASHSLGRPLDALSEDLAEGLALWQHAPGRAWVHWLEEQQSYRRQLAALIGAVRTDCVVPRTSAGQGLRSVLNMLPAGARVLSTAGEFDSLAMLLAQYAALKRIEVVLIEPGAQLDPGANGIADTGGAADSGDGRRFDAKVLGEFVRREAAAGRPVALVVVSQVFFATGQLLDGLVELAAACHRAGARLLIDSYHSLGVVPVNVGRLGCDYLVGGCYKYLRGGPGAAFLYLSPEVLAAGAQPLDTGWFALQPDGMPVPGGANVDARPRLRPGGDAHLEGTPAVLTWYQARSGLSFTRAIGVARLRAYSLMQLQSLKAMLRDRNIACHGGDAGHGAFLTVPFASEAGAAAAVEKLAAEGILVNARTNRVRLCPDCLTTGDELGQAAEALGRCGDLAR